MEYSVKRLTPFRLLSIYAYYAIIKGHNIYALKEVDVRDIRQKLRDSRKEDRNISFPGFLLSAIGNSLSNHVPSV